MKKLSWVYGCLVSLMLLGSMSPANACSCLGAAVVNAANPLFCTCPAGASKYSCAYTIGQNDASCPGKTVVNSPAASIPAANGFTLSEGCGVEGQGHVHATNKNFCTCDKTGYTFKPYEFAQCPAPIPVVEEERTLPNCFAGQTIGTPATCNCNASLRLFALSDNRGRLICNTIGSNFNTVTTNSCTTSTSTTECSAAGTSTTTTTKTCSLTGTTVTTATNTCKPPSCPVGYTGTPPNCTMIPRIKSSCIESITDATWTPGPPSRHIHDPIPNGFNKNIKPSAKSFHVEFSMKMKHSYSDGTVKTTTETMSKSFIMQPYWAPGSSMSFGAPRAAEWKWHPSIFSAIDDYSESLNQKACAGYWVGIPK